MNRPRSPRPHPLVVVAVAVLALAGSLALGLRRHTPLDYSRLEWAAAFDSLAAHLEAHYPYTAWKHVTWKDLAAAYRPQISAAEAAGDRHAFLAALGAFVGEVPGSDISVWTGSREDTACEPAVEVLDGGHGLLRPGCCGPPRPRLKRASRIAAGLDELMLEARVDGIVVDLRGCRSADRGLLELAGRFLPEQVTAESVEAYDATRDSFVTSGENRVDPWEPRFTGRVAVLVDDETAGAAELLAVALRRGPWTRVIGYARSAGSARAGNEVRVRMPAGITVAYYAGRSLDDRGRIQIETDRAGVGGIVPDLLLTGEDPPGRDVAVEKAQIWMGLGVLE